MTERTLRGEPGGDDFVALREKHSKAAPFGHLDPANARCLADYEPWPCTIWRLLERAAQDEPGTGLREAAERWGDLLVQMFVAEVPTDDADLMGAHLTDFMDDDLVRAIDAAVVEYQRFAARLFAAAPTPRIPEDDR